MKIVDKKPKYNFNLKQDYLYKIVKFEIKDKLINF